jgi:isocitrate dehydrogenase
VAAEKIINNYGKIQVPDNPIIPFIEGDGTGPDIWAASVNVFNSAVEKAYGGKRKIEWKEVTYDFARLMDGAEKLSCSGFGDAIVSNM